MRSCPPWAAVLLLAPAALAQTGSPKDPTSDRPGPPKLFKTQEAPAAAFGPRTTASDRCEDAPAAGDGDVVQYDLAAATNDYRGSCGGTETAPDAWFRVTVAAASRVTASTCGLATADTVLLATDGCGGAELACDDDNCGVQSRISFVLAAGSTAFIRIAGYSGNRHAGQVAVSVSPAADGPPPADQCGEAPEIGPGVYAYDLSAATHDGSGPCDASAAAVDVWYRVTTGASALLSASTCGRTAGDSVLSWVDGCGGPVRACSDDACGLQSRALAIVPARTTVLLRIADSRGGVHAGQVEVTAQDVDRPANDDCADATPITAGVPAPFDSTFADDDGSAPCGSQGEPGGHSIWFRFTPDQDGDMEVRTCDGTGFDTILTVYEGCGGPAVGCNNDACGLRSSLVAHTRAGVDYRIRVAGYLAAAGPGSVLLNAVAPCVVDRPPGSITENEPCQAGPGEDHNGGCNSPGQEVQPVPYGSVVYGTASTYTANGQPARDTDWYEVEFPAGEPYFVTTARAAFPGLRLFLLDTRCPPGVLASEVSGQACEEVSIFALPDPGVYRVMAASESFSGLPCGGLTDNHYTLTIGNPPAACTADFNGDGFVDFFDYADYVGCFETGLCPPGTTADVNGDDFVDFFDYADFVEAFAVGC